MGVTLSYFREKGKVKREKGKVKNRADAIWTKWRRDGTDGAGYIFSIFRTAEQ